MEIRYSCPSCGAGNRLPLGQAGSADPSPPCRSCGRSVQLAAAGGLPEDRAVTRCLVCGDDKLFSQKDFNPKVGCAVVMVGALLVPWTYGLSLGVFALADYLLYRRLPAIAVCYVCGARYRGLPVSPDLSPYDLLTAQTYEARAIHWRRANDHSSSPARRH